MNLLTGKYFDRVLIFCIFVAYPVSLLPVLLDYCAEYAYFQYAHWFNCHTWQSWFIGFHARCGDLLVIITLGRYLYSLFSGEVFRRPLYYYFWFLTFGIAIAASLSFTFLPGDQRAYWSLQVISRMPVYLDTILPNKLGTQISWIIMGGSVISDMTYQRWWVFHIGYCFILVWHGLWWATVRKSLIFNFRFLIAGAVTVIMLLLATLFIPECPGAPADQVHTPEIIPVVWHQWPIFKLVSIVSPLQAIGTIICIIALLLLLPWIFKLYIHIKCTVQEKYGT